MAGMESQITIDDADGKLGKEHAKNIQNMTEAFAFL